MAAHPGASASTEAFTRIHDSWLTSALGVDSWIVNSSSPSEGLLTPNLSQPVPAPAFLTAKVPAHDIQTVRQLAQLGFYLVDTALTLQLKSHLVSGSVPRSSDESPEWEVSDATPEDADAVGQIAGRALTKSRFHFDPNIRPEVASAVKSEWAKGLALGHRGIGCRVVRDANGIQGFLGIVEGEDGEGVFVIDLIAVHPEVQGLGVGTALVCDFLGLAQANGALPQVGTQAANTSAVRFYERLGFTLTKATYVMHAHLSMEEPL